MKKYDETILRARLMTKKKQRRKLNKLYFLVGMFIVSKNILVLTFFS